jgi:glycosyltransferase involved in cell wall biosynthesis
MNKSAIDVVMVTYNQEKYIAQAIESVLMQKTDFHFRLVIGEDFSTDNTRKICQEYERQFPNKIKLILHNKNQGLIKNYKSVFDICQAKYLAILEGDDYWIDDLKLQKQFNILQEYPEIGLIHTNFNVLNKENRIETCNQPKIKNLSGDLFYSLLLGNKITPLTVCFKKELMDKHFEYEYLELMNIESIDYFLWLEIAKHSKIHFMNETTGIYRRLDSSISNTNNFDKKIKFIHSSFSVIKYITDKYYAPEAIVKKAYNNLNLILLSTAINFSKFKEAKKYVALINPSSSNELIITLIGSSRLLIKLKNFLRLYTHK